jgi:PEP-CTERM motif
MKISLRSISLLPCMALMLAVGSVAHASSTFSGTAFCDIQYGPNNSGNPNIGNGNNPQGGTYATSGVTLATLSAAESTSAGQCSSFSGTNINFNSGGVYNNPTNTSDSLSSFLASGGATATFTAHTAANFGPTVTGNGSQDDGGTLFVIDGTSYLMNGDSIQLEHDDGAEIYVCLASGTCNYTTGAGFTLLGGAPAQTTGNQPNFTVSGLGATGALYDYELIGVTNYEQPAQLDSNINTFVAPSATPEPGSFVLLGTGLFAAAGMVRRRIAA